MVQPSFGAGGDFFYPFFMKPSAVSFLLFDESISSWTKQSIGDMISSCVPVDSEINICGLGGRWGRGG